MDDMTIITLVILLLGGLIIYAMVSGPEQAKAAYHEALDRLSADPTNVNLRSEALELGRAYSLSTGTRYVPKVTEADIKRELKRTINQAPAANSPDDMSLSATAHLPYRTRLKLLDNLLDNELLTDDEYQVRRSKILDETEDEYQTSLRKSLAGSGRRWRQLHRDEILARQRARRAER